MSDGNADCGGVPVSCTLQLRPANRANIRATNFRIRTRRSTCASAAAISSTARRIDVSKNRAEQAQFVCIRLFRIDPWRHRRAQFRIFTMSKNATESARAIRCCEGGRLGDTRESRRKNLRTIVGETDNEAATCKKLGILMRSRKRNSFPGMILSDRNTPLSSLPGARYSAFPPALKLWRIRSGRLTRRSLSEGGRATSFSFGAKKSGGGRRVVPLYLPHLSRTHAHATRQLLLSPTAYFRRRLRRRPTQMCASGRRSGSRGTPREAAATPMRLRRM